MVCQSVCLSASLSVCQSVCRDREASKNSRTYWNALWVVDSGRPRIRWGPDAPCERQFWGGTRAAHCKVIMDLLLCKSSWTDRDAI